MQERGRQTAEEVLQTSKEIVLFPQPIALMAWAIRAKKLGYVDDLDEAIGAFLEEYGSILHAIKRSTSDVLLIKTRISRLVERNGVLGIEAIDNPNDPQIDDFPTIDLRDSVTSPEKSFPRDMFTNVNNELIFVDPTVVPSFVEKDNMLLSPLGEGGKVLHAGEAILLTEDLWANPLVKKHVRMLQNKGYRFGVLPLVDHEKQKNKNFILDHIDGHANILVGKDGKLYLLCGKSYLRQGGKTSKEARRAAMNIGAELVEISDNDLRNPLSLNFVQINGNVIVSKSTELQSKLELIVGKDKVVPTEVPIIEIPEATKGGIRCMINTATPDLVRSLLSLA